MKVKKYKKVKKVSSIFEAIDKTLKSYNFRLFYPYKRKIHYIIFYILKKKQLKVRVYVFSNYLCNECLGYIELSINEYLKLNKKSFKKLIKDKFNNKEAS